MSLITDKQSPKNSLDLLTNSKVHGQNYAPFISKCPRFEGIAQQKSINLSNPLTDKNKKEQVSIKNSSRVLLKQKSNEKHQQQSIFKSKIGRFQHSVVIDTPSPGDYQIRSNTRVKTLQTLRAKLIKTQLKQPRQPTLPTIPDKRNKYGINIDNSQLGFVLKTEIQLEREKKLMKMYREGFDSSRNQAEKLQIVMKQIQKQLKQKVKEHLKEKQTQKQNREFLRKSQSQGKLKVNHLYQFNPKKKMTKMLPMSFERNSWDKSQKRTRFQFFNSSEKRFKNLNSLEVQKQRPTVRQYMNLASLPQKK